MSTYNLICFSAFFYSCRGGRMGTTIETITVTRPMKVRFYRIHFNSFSITQTTCTVLTALLLHKGAQLVVCSCGAQPSVLFQVDSACSHKRKLSFFTYVQGQAAKKFFCQSEGIHIAVMCPPEFRTRLSQVVLSLQLYLTSLPRSFAREALSA